MPGDGTEPIQSAERQPERRVRIVGQAITALIAEAPRLWPIIRRPISGYFERRADGWEARTGSGSPEQLAPLACGVLEAQVDPEAVLDLGCGAGAGTLFLAREFPQARVRGVDVSHAMVKNAQSRIGLDPEGRIAFRVADAYSLPYDDASFDLVVQTNVPVFAAELARVTRPSGYVVIASSQGNSTPFHTGRKRLNRVLEKNGFEETASGSAGSGTYVVARRSGGA